MVANTRVYLNELRGALEASLTAIGSAARVGHRRAEIVARHAAFCVLYTIGDLARAAEQADRTLELIQKLGARRFEAETLSDQALILLAQGHRQQALAQLDQALAISRETGIRFMGPWILGRIALATDDPQVRQNAIQECEELLREGCVSHNYFWFYHDAINASLKAGDWAQAEHFATALEDYTRAEPLPWSDFHIARGRALAATGRGQRDPATRQTLQDLIATAERLDWKAVIPALRDALACYESTPK
jgi:tetratricopeptide (TPR) repeat protein